jgi:hypothetical protein
MPLMTRSEVALLRPLAVRGSLQPGLYRYVHPMTGSLAPVNAKPFYTDILVTEVEGVPDSPRVAGKRYEYVNVNGYNSPNIDMRRGFLEDAGVLPRRKGHYKMEKCNLGHEHEGEYVPARYSENFLVPLAVFPAMR